MARQTEAQRRRQRMRCTKMRQRKFLRVLAATSDVAAACAASDLEWDEVCDIRLRQPEFAAAFGETIAAGYDRLEARALMLAEAALAPADGKPEAALAMLLLRQRRTAKAEPARARQGLRTAARKSSPDRDKAIATILKQVTARAAGAGHDGREDCAAEGLSRPGAAASAAE